MEQAHDRITFTVSAQASEKTKKAQQPLRWRNICSTSKFYYLLAVVCLMVVIAMLHFIPAHPWVRFVIVTVLIIGIISLAQGLIKMYIKNYD